jgi:hypothetical protein
VSTTELFPRGEGGVWGSQCRWAIAQFQMCEYRDTPALAAEGFPSLPPLKQLQYRGHLMPTLACSKPNPGRSPCLLHPPGMDTQGEEVYQGHPIMARGLSRLQSRRLEACLDYSDQLCETRRSMEDANGLFVIHTRSSGIITSRLTI